jgi:hypothetical protein
MALWDVAKVGICTDKSRRQETNFLYLWGSSRCLHFFPNADSKDDEKMHSVSDEEAETEGVTHLTFYQRGVEGVTVCIRFIQHYAIAARKMREREREREGEETAQP